MRPENRRMLRFLCDHGAGVSKVKYIAVGSLKGCWSIGEPGLCWTEARAEVFNRLGFTGFDGRPLDKFSGNGGLFSIFIRGHDELLLEPSGVPLLPEFDSALPSAADPSPSESQSRGTALLALAEEDKAWVFNCSGEQLFKLVQDELDSPHSKGSAPHGIAVFAAIELFDRLKKSLKITAKCDCDICQCY